MSAGRRDILLLADDKVAAELAELAGGDRFVQQHDGYEAMSEFARGTYQTVVLTHPQDDFAALVRGFHRLRGSARCYALCSPAGEAQLRLNGPEVDDYFIYPPRPGELDRILAGPQAGAAPRPGEGSAIGEGLSPQELAELVESAGTAQSLADFVAQLVSGWTGRKVCWAGMDDSRARGWPLLLLDDDPPRVLLADDSPEVSDAARAKLAALQPVLGALAIHARRADALHELAITDHLTGAYNRRYFYHFTDQLLVRAEEEHTRVTLLLYDIDDFKRYNDTYGHAAGDDILRETARLMTQATREHDIVARIGGDEFAVLFWDSGPPRQPDSQHPDSAQELAQRFLVLLAGHEFQTLGPEAKGVLTISGGLATFPRDGKTCRELLRRADLGLRAAKASGKSTIYLVGVGAEPEPIARPDPAEDKAPNAEDRPRPPQP